jgi:hypothetical protein
MSSDNWVEYRGNMRVNHTHTLGQAGKGVGSVKGGHPLARPRWDVMFFKDVTVQSSCQYSSHQFNFRDEDMH